MKSYSRPGIRMHNVPQLVFQDTFTRANNFGTGGHWGTPDVGAAWVDTGVPNTWIAANCGLHDSTNAYAWQTMGVGDHELRAIVDGRFGSMTLAVQVSDNNDRDFVTGYYLRAKGGFCSLWRQNSIGSATQVAVTGYEPGLDVDLVNIAMRNEGATIHGSATKGSFSQSLTWTDPSPLQGVYAGTVSFTNNTSVYYSIEGYLTQ